MTPGPAAQDAMQGAAVEPAAALFHQGTAALAAGDAAGAEALWREALQHDPDLAEAHANLALLLDQRGAPQDALAHYALASALQPDNARIHLNHGALLAGQKAHAEAEAAYLRALDCDPLLPGIWSNLGVLLALTWRDDEAETCYRTALTIDPAHPGAHFNLACLLLRHGRYDEGWQHFETRDWYAAVQSRIQVPRWQGQPLAGASVLMVYEAGHGDMIQFCRYAPLLVQRGAAAVDMLCHPALQTLMATLPGLRAVMAYDQPWPTEGWDYWVPVMSLPSLFDTRLDTIPAALPYLRAGDYPYAPWHDLLDTGSPSACRRVGLVWQGSAAFENDAERSLPSLGVLAPLWQVPGLCFVSLQKGRGEQEVASLAATQPLLDMAPYLDDFADTAAVIGQLDLVITVDTAVAHLAGALGKPCWVLLPAYMTDWRWLQAREDSPWYPGVMRLFRQAPGQGWLPVITALRDALSSWAVLNAPRPCPQPGPATGPDDGSARSG